MSNENNNNQQNIEQEQIKNKNWWKMLFGITQTYKVQIKLILIILLLGISFNKTFANVLSVNDNLNKPGLHYIGEMDVKRANHKSIMLPNNKILIVGGYQKNNIINPILSMEIIDLQNKKSELLDNKINEDIRHIEVIDNDNILMIGSYFDIYNLHQNKFIQSVYLSKLFFPNIIECTNDKCIYLRSINSEHIIGEFNITQEALNNYSQNFKKLPKLYQSYESIDTFEKTNKPKLLYLFKDNKKLMHINYARFDKDKILIYPSVKYNQNKFEEKGQDKIKYNGYIYNLRRQTLSEIINIPFSSSCCSAVLINKENILFYEYDKEKNNSIFTIYNIKKQKILNSQNLKLKIQKAINIGKYILFISDSGEIKYVFNIKNNKFEILPNSEMCNLNIIEGYNILKLNNYQILITGGIYLNKEKQQEELLSSIYIYTLKK